MDYSDIEKHPFGKKGRRKLRSQFGDDTMLQGTLCLLNRNALKDDVSIL